MQNLTKLPFYSFLTEKEQLSVDSNIFKRTFDKGEFVHNGGNDCSGLIMVESGNLKAYIVSESGKQLTLYRLEENDLCLFSASCIFDGMDFEVFISAEKQSTVQILPAKDFKNIQANNIYVNKFITELMAKRLTDIMWLIEHTIFKSFDSRLASFLIDKSSIENSLTFNITHDEIAKNLGTAREVVSRMLKHFENENLILQQRSVIQIVQINRLINLSK